MGNTVRVPCCTGSVRKSKAEEICYGMITTGLKSFSKLLNSFQYFHSSHTQRQWVWLSIAHLRFLRNAWIGPCIQNRCSLVSYYSHQVWSTFSDKFFLILNEEREALAIGYSYSSHEIIKLCCFLQDVITSMVKKWKMTLNFEILSSVTTGFLVLRTIWLHWSLSERRDWRGW